MYKMKSAYDNYLPNDVYVVARDMMDFLPKFSNNVLYFSIVIHSDYFPSAG